MLAATDCEARVFQQICLIKEPPEKELSPTLQALSDCSHGHLKFYPEPRAYSVAQLKDRVHIQPLLWQRPIKVKLGHNDYSSDNDPKY